MLRTLLNTGTFVGTVGPVFQDPAVASAVAARATDELFTELDLQARLRDALPPKASFAAVPITNATKGYVAGEHGGSFHLRRLHRPQHGPPHQPGPGQGVGPGL